MECAGSWRISGANVRRDGNTEGEDKVLVLVNDDIGAFTDNIGGLFERPQHDEVGNAVDPVSTTLVF